MPDHQTLFHIVTDLHHGPDRKRKLGSRALDLVDGLVADVGAMGSSFLFDLGDHINDVGPEEDRRFLTQLAERYAGLAVPRRHAIGDHDVVNLSVDEVEACLGTVLAHGVIEFDHCRVVLFTPNVKYPDDFGAKGYLCAPHDIAWLQQALSEGSKPSIVLSHVPLWPLSMVGNAYFAERPWLGQYRNAAALTDVLRAAPNLLACLAGDTHQPYAFLVDEVPYVGLPSATEAIGDTLEPSGAWARVSVDASGLTVSLTGARPMSWSWAPPVRGAGITSP